MASYVRLICFAIGYIIGCFQTAYIVGRLFKKIDIRKYGSGNSGATNAVRVLGSKIGALVFFLDFLKAILAFTVCSIIFDGSGSFYNGANGALPGIYAGLGAVIGHNFPVFLKFKGGKGVAASLGVIFCLDLRIALILYAIGIATVIITRYISLMSLIILGTFPILLVFFDYSMEIIMLGLIFCLLSFFMHRANIKRLLNNSENKFTLKTKGKIQQENLRNS